jgi:hypothetical protein
MQLQEANALIKLYQDRCKLQQVEPTQAVAEALLATYVSKGETEAYLLLDEFELTEKLASEQMQALFNL